MNLAITFNSQNCRLPGIIKKARRPGDQLNIAVNSSSAVKSVGAGRDAALAALIASRSAAVMMVPGAGAKSAALAKA